MLHNLRAAAVALGLASSLVLADSSIPTCGAGNPCPASAPCCSQYGQCGTGAYCLGGCDPEYSHTLDSCMPAPVCKSGDFKMNSLDDVAANTEYLGDSSKANWVSSGIPVAYQNNAILLTMAPDTVGTLLSSTHYVWYGKISATMTTSQGAGVVTAFIMMSDVKDEIDFEFVGVDLEHAQSNYYFQGITDYDNEKNLTVSNTVTNTHTYTFDWQPDYIAWSIDGQVQRTKFRNETYNSTSGQYHFPQTPARIQLSLWPAGLAKNGQGTIDWAGGLVDWNSPYMTNGYYYAMVNDVSVDCYDPPAGYKNQGSKSYKYTTTYGTNDTVAITNDNTILSSFTQAETIPLTTPTPSRPPLRRRPAPRPPVPPPQQARRLCPRPFLV
ncbi:putative glycosidase CRH2 [Taxawa tesnikishii (nom. ined.)]|nr:putative glycosidase CRH2 [Dothideales sp. JES 119]